MKNILLGFFLALGLLLQAQKKEDSKEKPKKTLSELTQSSIKKEGFFTVYQDSLNGKIKLLIQGKQLEKDFIHFSQVGNGVYEAGAIKGGYNKSTILQFRKYFNKIELVAPNTNFYFDPANPISKSARSNTSEAVLLSQKIILHDSISDAYLINADPIFISEVLTRIKEPAGPSSPPTSFRLGSLDKTNSKITAIKNYPKNTNVNISYVYKNPMTLNLGSDAVADGRYVTIELHHSFIEMPEAGYEVRFDDPRVGYFIEEIDDLTGVETTNYRDLVHRWRLVKKDSTAVVSEPVKPITWWIENTTPYEWRTTIKEGVLAWNEAFEKAGFSNAMEVKVQPDDAAWDAGDITYNVLRWTSSPRPPFSGYGPSMVNPRTGEILAADIMLEYAHFTNKAFYDRLFYNSQENMSLSQQESINDLRPHEFKNCAMGVTIHENILFGTTILSAFGASDLELTRLNKEALKSLVMHEIGHTLGLNHNMKASHLFSPEQLEDAEFIEGKALTASVMDYEAINITRDPKKQGQFENMAIGPYDIWAIQFGYTPFENEEERTALLERSTERELIFGNDADDMRSAGKGIDPKVMTYDLSSDPLLYSENRFKLINESFARLLTQFKTEGESYEALRKGYFVLNAEAAKAGEVISRFIGGVYVDRALHGQKDASQPYTPVSLSDQKQAFKLLENYIFSPTAFNAPTVVYNYLAKQRRGFNFFGGPEDPKIQKYVLGYQTRVLAHLLHPNTLQRISDSELYGNAYSLAVFMTDMNKAIFDGDIKGNVNTFRQNLQTAYVTRLIAMIKGEKADRFIVPAQSMAIYNLKQLQKKLRSPKGDLASVAHKTHLKTRIKNALEAVH